MSFFGHVGNFHYFNPAVTFGIPESFSLPFLGPPRDSEAQTSEGPLGIFTSVGIEDEGHCVRFSTTGVELGEEFVGF